MRDKFPSSDSRYCTLAGSHQRRKEETSRYKCMLFWNSLDNFFSFRTYCSWISKCWVMTTVRTCLKLVPVPVLVICHLPSSRLRNNLPRILLPSYLEEHRIMSHQAGPSPSQEPRLFIIFLTYLFNHIIPVPPVLRNRIQIRGIRIISLYPDPYKKMAGSGIRIRIRIKCYGSGST